MGITSVKTHYLISMAGEHISALASQVTAYLRKWEQGTSLECLAKASHKNNPAKQAFHLSIVVTHDTDIPKIFLLVQNHLADNPKDRLWRPDLGVYYDPNFTSHGLAFLFPGQGSQSIAMGRGFKEIFPSYKNIWDLGNSMDWEEGITLGDIIFPEDVDSEPELARHQARLTATQWAQPAIGLTSAGFLAILNALGVKPQCSAGHSFGEITALYSAGVFDFKNFILLARKRGELMSQSHGTSGSMTAVTGEVTQLINLLSEWNSQLTIANYNTPRQTVLAGSMAELEKIQGPLSQAGFHCTSLNVGAAFHSPLVANTQEGFLSYLAGVPFSEPKLPVFSNLTARAYPTDGESIRKMLSEHLASPVRFQEMIEAIYASGVKIFLEVGSGQTLSRLTDKCLQGRECITLAMEKKPGQGTHGILHCVGALFALGIPINLDIFH